MSENWGEISGVTAIARACAGAMRLIAYAERYRILS